MKTVDPYLTPAERREHGDIFFHELAGMPWFEQSNPVEIDRVRPSRSMGTKAQQTAYYLPADRTVSFDGAEYDRGNDHRRALEMSRYIQSLEVIG